MLSSMVWYIHWTNKSDAVSSTEIIHRHQEQRVEIKSALLTSIPRVPFEEYVPLASYTRAPLFMKKQGTCREPFGIRRCAQNKRTIPCGDQLWLVGWELMKKLFLLKGISFYSFLGNEQPVFPIVVPTWYHFLIGAFSLPLLHSPCLSRLRRQQQSPGKYCSEVLILLSGGIRVGKVLCE